MERRRVLVYVPQVLPIFQPWIRDQLTHLKCFDAALAGRKRVQPSIKLDDLNTFCIAQNNQRQIENIRFLLTGRSSTLEAFVREYSPHLIHAHFGPGATEIARIARRTNTPLIASYHGYDSTIGSLNPPTGLYERIHLWRRASMFKQAKLILTTSQYMEGVVASLGCNPQKIRTHYLGLDTRYFAAPTTRPPSRSLVFVGRLTDFKGVDLALDVVSALKSKGVEANLTMIGDGPKREHIERRIADESLSVKLTGPLPREEVREILSKARVHLFPSTAKFNGRPEFLGVAPLEAQAMGVPSVGIRTGGVSEVIRHRETGYLTDDGDLISMVSYVQQLLTDDVLHKKMSASAIKFIQQEFELSNQVKRLEETYLKVIESR